MWIERVIAFWFDELEPKDWWGGSPAIDETIRARFATVREDLIREMSARGSRGYEELNARGHLATVIVLDQFSRNLFRDSAEAFATDALALAVALDAIDRGLDRSLDEAQRQFLYMPLMHSEDAAMQARSLIEFATLRDPRSLRSARQHHDTITRFGRFPYRNAALGRESTDEERAFLAKHPSPE